MKSMALHCFLKIDGLKFIQDQKDRNRNCLQNKVTAKPQTSLLTPSNTDYQQNTHTANHYILRENT